MDNLHQTPGCILEQDRFYIFDAETGAQLVDQPRRGFQTIQAARMWLSDFPTGMGPERFRVAQGRDAERA
jgi:hypothetical protein